MKVWTLEPQSAPEISASKLLCAAKL